MVNFRDPNVILKDGWALVKLCHAIDSLYLWEFFTSLDYEWSVIRGRRPYRWTIWIYSLTRMSALVAVILNLVGIDVTSPFDCQAWITFVLIFAYIAFAAASLLIVLRDIAIWNRNMVIIAISIGAWVVNVAFLIQGIARLRSKWYHVVDSCVPTNTESNKLNIIVTLVTDVILLLIMLVGLIRLRRNGAGTFGLGQLLWRQGVIWFFFATVAEVPPTVFVSLNLNSSLFSSISSNPLTEFNSVVTSSIQPHVPSSRVDHNDNLCDADVSLSHRLCIQLLRHRPGRSASK